MSPSSKQFLRYLADQPKGRVGYAQVDWPQAFRVAREVLDAGYVKERRFGLAPGFQITPAGKAYLAGEAVE